MLDIPKMAANDGKHKKISARQLVAVLEHPAQRQAYARFSVRIYRSLNQFASEHPAAFEKWCLSRRKQWKSNYDQRLALDLMSCVAKVSLRGQSARKLAVELESHWHAGAPARRRSGASLLVWINASLFLAAAPGLEASDSAQWLKRALTLSNQLTQSNVGSIEDIAQNIYQRLEEDGKEDEAKQFNRWLRIHYVGTAA